MTTTTPDLNANQIALVTYMNGTALRAVTLEAAIHVLKKSETTARKALKELVDAGLVLRSGNAWMLKSAPVEDDKVTASGKKKYKKNPKPIREVRKNRITRAVLTVRNAEEVLAGGDEWYDAVDFTLDDIGYDGSKWVTVCNDHKQIVGSDFILDAWHHNSWPAFCTDCRKLMKPSDTKIAAVRPSSKKKGKDL